MLAQSRLARASALPLAMICIGVGACGGDAGPHLQVATRVCRGDRSAVRHALGAASLKIVDRNPANIECMVSGGGVRVDVVAQASSAAWTEFDTLVSHQAQGFEGAGSNPASKPVDLAGLGYNAAWIASDSKLLATNGTQFQGGSFVTVTVAGRAPNGTSKVGVAKAVASATLAAAPRGPNPGPPPS
jgi:hypothetical protein